MASCLWVGLYWLWPSLTQEFVYGTLSLQGPIADALNFFLYDTVKIILLLVLMVYVLAWIRASLNTEYVRQKLTGISPWLGYCLASLFGAITPFCSCSSIPLFLGFTASGIPLGFTLAFLITSPLINEVAIVILWGLLGSSLTLTYIAIGLIAGILGGFFVDTIKADRWLYPEVKNLRDAKSFSSPVTCTEKLTFEDRHRFAQNETQTILRRVTPWVVMGVGVGAVIHGFIPQEWMTHYLGKNNFWAVPTAVAFGIPLYTNVTGVIPVMESLLTKGLPLGTTLAFCMSTVAASLPEFIMLKQVMTYRLLALFFGYLLVIFTLMGWGVNFFESFLS